MSTRSQYRKSAANEFFPTQSGHPWPTELILAVARHLIGRFFQLTLCRTRQSEGDSPAHCLKARLNVAASA